MAAPQLDLAREKTDISILLKTRIVGFQVSFRLRQVFAALNDQALSLVSIKPISTTTTTNFEPKQSDQWEG